MRIPLILSCVFFLLTHHSRAQDEPAYTKYFEANLGMATYNSLPLPLQDFSLRFGGSMASGKVEIGGLFRGYTSMASMQWENIEGSAESISPYGFQTGLFLRACAPNSLGYFYGELAGSFGYLFLRERSILIREEGQNLEYLGGVNLGHNFTAGSNSFFNLYAGAKTGELPFLQNADDGRQLIRLEFGLGFQVRL